jgi:hypothetical protein
MNNRKIHLIAGWIIALFVSIHLFNHLWSIFGVAKHIELMNRLRPYYRNTLAETVLLLAVLVQIVSGLKLFILQRKIAKSPFEKLQIWSGLYLAVFFFIHLTAVFAGRWLLHLDTNFYFGAAGLNHFPSNLFFIPYYALAIIAFFGHIAAIHSKKMKRSILGLQPSSQSSIIVVLGICISLFTIYGLTNHFRGLELPAAYKVLVGE